MKIIIDRGFHNTEVTIDTKGSNLMQSLRNAFMLAMQVEGYPDSCIKEVLNLECDVDPPTQEANPTVFIP
jgi:hypothetical protein